MPSQLQIQGLKGPTVKHLFVLARRHRIPVGVELPNHAEGVRAPVEKTGFAQFALLILLSIPHSNIRRNAAGEEHFHGIRLNVCAT